MCVLVERHSRYNDVAILDIVDPRIKPKCRRFVRLELTDTWRGARANFYVEREIRESIAIVNKIGSGEESLKLARTRGCQHRKKHIHTQYGEVRSTLADNPEQNRRIASHTCARQAEQNHSARIVCRRGEGRARRGARMYDKKYICRPSLLRLAWHGKSSSVNPA